MVTEDSSPSQGRSRASPFGAAFFRPRTFLPQEHGGWFLFLTPLAVGLAVGGAWNGRAAAFVIAALTTFLIRQPLDLALRSLAGKRPRADLPAVATWLGIYAVLAALASGYLLLGARLWGMLPLGVGAAALLGLQLWAAHARLARTAWSEVISTAGLGLSAAGAYYAATGVWSNTPLALWMLTALQGVGGVLYSRWRLRRRRLAARGLPQGGVPRVSVLSHHAAGLCLAFGLACAGWAPWAVVPLYALLLGRVAWGTRPSAPPDRSAVVVGVGEGIATLLSGLWLALAFRLF